MMRVGLAAKSDEDWPIAGAAGARVLAATAAKPDRTLRRGRQHMHETLAANLCLRRTPAFSPTMSFLPPAPYCRSLLDLGSFACSLVSTSAIVRCKRKTAKLGRMP